jgi:glycerophosphoryl diester phosphodiesterase
MPAATATATKPGRILVHGHRGARAVMPENTMPAFEYALKVGVDVLELDLAVTRDNELVVSHDPVLHEEICTPPAGGSPSHVIRELTYAQVRLWDCGAKKNPHFPEQTPAPGTRMPSLDEVLALAPRGSFEFNIETKIFRDKPQYTPAPEEFARLLVGAIRRHKLEKRVIIQSFDDRTLIAAAQLAPEIRRSFLYAGPMKDLVAMTKAAQSTILSCFHTLATGELVAKAHAASLQVVPWTANRPDEWDRLIGAGVDAIISDDPAKLIRHLESKALRGTQSLRFD